jgi:hypothetical protein
MEWARPIAIGFPEIDYVLRVRPIGNISMRWHGRLRLGLGRLLVIGKGETRGDKDGSEQGEKFHEHENAPDARQVSTPLKAHSGSGLRQTPNHASDHGSIATLRRGYPDHGDHVRYTTGREILLFVRFESNTAGHRACVHDSVRVF